MACETVLIWAKRGGDGFPYAVLADLALKLAALHRSRQGSPSVEVGSGDIRAVLANRKNRATICPSHFPLTRPWTVRQSASGERDNPRQNEDHSCHLLLPRPPLSARNTNTCIGLQIKLWPSGIETLAISRNYLNIC